MGRSILRRQNASYAEEKPNVGETQSGEETQTREPADKAASPEPDMMRWKDRYEASNAALAKVEARYAALKKEKEKVEGLWKDRYEDANGASSKRKRDVLR